MAFSRYKDWNSRNRSKGNMPGSPEEADVSAFVDRSARGDRDAFGKLYDMYIERIYKYVYYHTGDAMVSEDLTQDIFIKAWGAINRFEWKGQPFSSWLFRIAHNCTVDYYRSSQRESLLKEQLSTSSAESEPGFTIANPVQEVERKLTHQELLNAISNLSAAQKEVIILKFLEGMENHEIAQITGKKEGAIRITQMRALAALREIMSRERNK
jgi:RNA polymerase sigma-70 factor (ECF subfamily)